MFSPADIAELKAALATVERLQLVARNTRDVAPRGSTELTAARNVAEQLGRAKHAMNDALYWSDNDPPSFSEDQIDEGLKA